MESGKNNSNNNRDKTDMRRTHTLWHTTGHGHIKREPGGGKTANPHVFNFDCRSSALLRSADTTYSGVSCVIVGGTVTARSQHGHSGVSCT